MASVEELRQAVASREAALKASGEPYDKEYSKLLKSYWKARYFADVLKSRLPSFDASSHQMYVNAIEALERARKYYQRLDDYMREKGRGGNWVRGSQLEIFSKRGRPSATCQTDPDPVKLESVGIQAFSEKEITWHEGPCRTDWWIELLQRQHEQNLREIVAFDELKLLGLNEKNDNISCHGVTDRGGPFRKKLGCECDHVMPPRAAGIENPFQNLPLSPVEYFREQAPSIARSYYGTLRERHNVLYLSSFQKKEVERAFLHGTRVGQWGVAYCVSNPHQAFSLKAQNRDLVDLFRCVYKKILNVLGARKELRMQSQRSCVEIDCFSNMFASFCNILDRNRIYFGKTTKSVKNFEPICSYEQLVELFCFAGLRTQDKKSFFTRIFKKRSYRLVCTQDRTVLITYFVNRRKLRFQFYYQPIIA